MKKTSFFVMVALAIAAHAVVGCANSTQADVSGSEKLEVTAPPLGVPRGTIKEFMFRASDNPGLIQDLKPTDMTQEAYDIIDYHFVLSSQSTVVLSSLIPYISFYYNDDAVAPASGIAKDFSQIVEYKVTPTSGIGRVYRIHVTKAVGNEKQLTSFVLCSDENPSLVEAPATGTSPALWLPATINEATATVTLDVPAGADLSALRPRIETSFEATISPAHLAIQDFSTPVVYTVTAADGTSRQYTVTVKK
jgi:hypothetical protein